MRNFSWDKRKDNLEPIILDKWTDFLWENKISELYIKINITLGLCKLTKTIV